MCHSLPTNGVDAESKVSDVVAKLGSKRDQQMGRLTFANLGPVQCCRDLATNYDPWTFRSRCLAAMAAAIELLTRVMTPHLWARGFRPGRWILAGGGLLSLESESDGDSEAMKWRMNQHTPRWPAEAADPPAPASCSAPPSSCSMTCLRQTCIPDARVVLRHEKVMIFFVFD